MALVRKILETTLTAGATSVTFTDTDIPNSLLRVYCTKASLFPLSQTLSGNVLSVNYKAQTENVGVALEIVKQGLDIVDSLTSEDATKALSANQGYVLKGLIDGIVIPTVPDKITDLSDVDVESITSGQVLAWDAVSEKFVNVNQSGGGSSLVYSDVEQEVGTWLDGRTIYKKSYITTASINLTSYTWVSTGISSTGIDMIIQGELVRINNKGKIVVSYFVDSDAGVIKLMNLSDYALSCSTGSIITLFYVKPVTP